MAKRKNNLKSKKTLTINELKTWLDGYCSAHESTWCPTLEQWNMIKEKIFALSEDETFTENQVTKFPIHPVFPQQLINPVEQLPPVYPDSAFGNGHSGTAPINDGGPRLGSSERPFKTPNKIDGGNGKSDFG